jgi:hypothetical protein
MAALTLHSSRQNTEHHLWYISVLINNIKNHAVIWQNRTNWTIIKFNKRGLFLSVLLRPSDYWLSCRRIWRFSGNDDKAVTEHEPHLVKHIFLSQYLYKRSFLILSFNLFAFFRMITMMLLPSKYCEYFRPPEYEIHAPPIVTFLISLPW